MVNVFQGWEAGAVNSMSINTFILPDLHPCLNPIRHSYYYFSIIWAIEPEILTLIEESIANDSVYESLKS